MSSGINIVILIRTIVAVGIVDCEIIRKLSTGRFRSVNVSFIIIVRYVHTLFLVNRTQRFDCSRRFVFLTNMTWPKMGAEREFPGQFGSFGRRLDDPLSRLAMVD